MALPQVDDSGLASLVKDIKEHNPIGFINNNPNNSLSEICSFIIQWEDIIQSFEVGMVYIMGLLRDKYPVMKKYDYKLMSLINFRSVWNRSENTVFEFIKAIHAKNGIKILERDIKETESLIWEFIHNDSEGIIFNKSPLLSFLNSIINLYLDGECSSILFVVDEKYTKSKNGMKSFANLLKSYFPESNGKPIYIDTRKDSFLKYLSDNKCLKPNTVVVTSDIQTISSIATSTKLQDITVIYPEIKRLHLTNDYAPMLALLNQYMEFICYNNKPFVIKKLNDK